jgi:hypothetical protein
MQTYSRDGRRMDGEIIEGKYEKEKQVLQFIKQPLVKQSVVDWRIVCGGMCWLWVMGVISKQRRKQSRRREQR